MADSKSISLLTFVFLALGTLQLSRCQDDTELQCPNLDVGNQGMAVSGADLSFCSTTELQCCTQDYIDQVTTRVTNALRGELRTQLWNTGAVFNRTVNSISSYFNSDFVNGFVRILSSLVDVGGISIDFDTVLRVAGNTVRRIPENIVINDTTVGFNATQFTIDVIDNLATAAASGLSLGNRETSMCIVNAVKSNINLTDVVLIVRAIDRIRRAFTVIVRASSFLYSYATNTEFRFPSNCVRRFVELNFCARCRGQTPPLCSNTCGALVRGCLSAYYSALSQQFDILWNVSRQVLTITNETLHTLFNEERQLVDHTAVISGVTSCVGGSLPFPGKRQTGGGSDGETYLPRDRMQELRNLTGIAFRYTRDEVSRFLGPVICRPSVRERTFCNQNGVPRTEYCASEEPCSSSCRCYNGMSEQEGNTDEFNVDGIEGQENNPAIDLDSSELVEIATSVGTPVSSFLMQSDLVSVIPEGVDVPEGQPFGSGSTTLAVSMTAMLLGAIAVLMHIN